MGKISKEAIQNELKKIAKRIDKIEDKVVDYKSDKTWQKLRATQDVLYKQLKGFESTGGINEHDNKRNKREIETNKQDQVM